MLQTLTTDNIITQRQFDILNDLMHGLTHGQIADKYSLSRQTIERDIAKILNNQEFMDCWLKDQWVNVYGRVLNDDPRECLRALTQLLKRSGDYNITQNNISALKITFGKDNKVVDAEVKNGDS